MSNGAMEVRDAAASYAPQMKQDVPPGYKRTEVGVIPEDWNLIALRKVAAFGGGTTPARALYDRYYISGVHNWVKTLDLNNGVISCTEECVTDAALIETSLRKYNPGTVLIAMYGGFNQIGRTGLLRIKAAINQALVAIIPDIDKLSSEYLLFSLNYNIDYWRGVASSSRKDPNITSNDVKDYKVMLPSLSEQRAIAAALSDVDALITALDRLIAKKRAIKTAAMQQLLTGKTRLPGFTGEWETKRLGESLEVLRNGAVYKYTHREGLPITRIETIADGAIDYSKVGFAKKSDELVSYKMKSGDILYSHINSIDHIGKVARYDGAKVLYHGMNLLLLRPSKLVSSEWLYFVLCSNFARNWSKSVAKQAVSQASINTRELSKFEILVPCLEEQTAIAQVLSGMDAEIAALEARREKTRAIKQGMMQQLLTGRVRLVKPNSKEAA